MDMLTVRALGVAAPGESFELTTIKRRPLGPRDVLIDISYAGVCHMDVLAARDTSGHTPFPLVPGHEIVGHVAAVGNDVTRFAVGDPVGVGPVVESCGSCRNCLAGNEHQCTVHPVRTFGDLGADGLPTMGGFSQRIVVAENFVVRLPTTVDLPTTAPLLCVGVAAYGALRRWGCGPGTRVGVCGFGGLGHIALQIAKALGSHVTVLDWSRERLVDAGALGADDARYTGESETFLELAGTMDIVLLTVPEADDVDSYLALLAHEGVLVPLAMPDKRLSIDESSLIANDRVVAGSRAGGISKTEEALEFCAEHGIAAMVEMIEPDYLDQAFSRVDSAEVRFRFVIDMATL